MSEEISSEEIAALLARESMSEEMTREQAIEELSILLNMYQDSTTGDALDVAIDAVKFYEKAEVVISQLREDRDRLQTVADAKCCEDAISRQAAIDEFKRVYFDNETVIRCAELILGGMPSVTPKQRTGHWIETAEEYYKAVNEYGGGVNEDTPYFVDDIACSECLSMFSVIDNETERFDCCPSCGTRMVEPQESEGV